MYAEFIHALGVVWGDIQLVVSGCEHTIDPRRRPENKVKRRECKVKFGEYANWRFRTLIKLSKL